MLFLLFAAFSFAETEPLQTLRVATYNVENLFDAELNQEIHPYTGKRGDEEYCPQSWRRWTHERYMTKVDHLAWVLGQMKPDILTLNEVENRGVVEELRKCAKEKYGWNMPYIAHFDTPDPRGIDMAVMSRFKIEKTRYFPVRGHRGTLMVDIAVDGTKVHILANHWKSQIGDAEANIAMRTKEASGARGAMISYLVKDLNAVVLSCGDYNEDFDGPAMMAGMRPALDRDTALKSLEEPVQEIRPYSLIGDIPASGRGSFFYARRSIWNTFDGIIVAPRMLLPVDEEGPDWRVGTPEETVTFKRPEMLFGKEGRPNSYKRIRAEGANEYYTNGYSDHFPILTVLHRSASPAKVEPLKKKTEEKKAEAAAPETEEKPAETADDKAPEAAPAAEEKPAAEESAPAAEEKTAEPAPAIEEKSEESEPIDVESPDKDEPAPADGEKTDEPASAAEPDPSAEPAVETPAEEKPIEDAPAAVEETTAEEPAPEAEPATETAPAAESEAPAEAPAEPAS